MHYGPDMRIHTLLPLPALLLAGAGLLACGEADRTFDCATICNTYQECIDSSLDLSECVDTCEDQTDANETLEAQADACDDCLEDRACAESGPCAETCVPVIQASIN